MPRVDHLLRSTPFRLALTFTSLFIVGFLLAGAAIYELMRADLSERLDESVSQTYSVVSQTYSDHDLDDLISSIDSHVKLSPSSEQLFSLTDAGGGHVAGNFNAKGISEGFSDLRDGAFGIPSDTHYRAFSGAVGDNILTVAFSYGETEELQTILLTGFGWATVVVTGLAIIGGALLAIRAQRRLDTIAATMDDVSHGRMDARIPLIGNGDDIDRVSEQVNAALDRLSALVRSVRQVSTDIAHELKTPLNRLQLILEAASARQSGEVQSQIEEAQNEVSQINETFEALLRIAQIEAGARKARFSTLDLNAVVRNIAEIYTDVAGDGNRQLSVEPSTPPAHLQHMQKYKAREHFRASEKSENSLTIVFGDWELLTQLFANLVENAIRHTAVGSRITLRVRREGTEVVAVVADSGPGIPIEEHDKVFQRLYRMDKSRTTPGTGLGLSLVKAVADLHGAVVELGDNQPGLRVTIRFPGT